MSDICTELRQLRLNGMADAWSDMESQGDLTVQSSGWLLKHLLQAELELRFMPLDGLLAALRNP